MMNIEPSSWTSINISKEFVRKKLKEDPYFLPWNSHMEMSFRCAFHGTFLSTFAIESRHAHVFMSVCRCHWHAVQVVLSQSCLDHLWNIHVRVQGAFSAPEPILVIVFPSVGF